MYMPARDGHAIYATNAAAQEEIDKGGYYHL